MKISIKNFLSLGIVIGIIVLVSLITFSSYYSTKQAMTKNTNNIMNTISEFALNKSKQYLLTARDAADLTQRLESKKVVTSKNKDLMIKYFYEQLRLNKQFSSIYYADLDGNFIMVLKTMNGYMVKVLYNKDELIYSKRTYYDEKLQNVLHVLEGPDIFDPRNRPWYKQALESKSIIWTDPYVFFTSQEPGITTASPIYHNGGINGVIGVDIEISELSNFITNLKISENSKVFIMDNSLKMIAFPDVNTIEFDNITQTTKLKDINSIGDDIVLSAYNKLLDSDIETIDKKVFLTFNSKDNVTYHALFSPFRINNINWTVGMYVPQDDYLGTIKENQKFNIILTIIFGGIFMLIGYYIAKSIIKPLTSVIETTKELKSMNLNVPCIEKTVYVEINDLIDHTNTMKESLKEAYTDTLFRLALASEYKDTDTASHIKRIGLYCVEIGKHLGLNDDQLYILEHASTMHDIGKLAIDDKILLKPGKLTLDERKEMMKHSELGAKLLDNPTSEIMKEAREISLYHHEKWNGQGYPKGLKADEIPLYARIVAVADVFDALVSRRCYKDEFTYEDSKKIILEGKGSHFDPKCVEAFELAYEELIKIHKIYKDSHE